MEFDKKTKIINLIALLIIISAVAALIWYSPNIFKGYSTVNIWNGTLVARNQAKYDVFGAEDKQNIILASSLAEERAQISTEGNRLNYRIISLIFKAIGVPKYENLIFVSVFILVLALLVFTLIVYYLFDLKTAAIFAFIYILLPFNWWYGPYNFGIYEICLLFFSLFFFFFIIGLKSEWKYRNILIVFSGIFLALAGMAKEAIWPIVPILFLFLLSKKQKRVLLYLFIPFLIIISIFWLPNMLSGENSYLSMLKAQSNQSFLSWDFICHFFPDPYTYHFNRQEYLERFESEISSDTEFIASIKMKKALSEGGIKNPSLLERFKIGTANLLRHLSRFAAIEDIGGPLILLLMILGFVYLRDKDKYFYQFFIFWIVFTFLFLSYIIIASRTHLIDFGFIIALATTLGLLVFIDVLSKSINFGEKGRTLLGIFLTFLVLYSLVLSSHVLWGKVYDETHYSQILAYGQEINRLRILDEEVIAVNLDQFKINKLNYLTDKSMVVFAPETIEELIKEGKLQEAFGKFDIKYIIGYSPELTEKILTTTKVNNIASDNIELSLPEISPTKSWFMNLIR